MANTALFFHETFQPELGYISKLLELGAEKFSGDKYKISEITGIPTGKEKGKVEPHIRYARYMGLIEYSVTRGLYDLSLTRIGEEVLRQDKYLHEALTLWLLHYFISRREQGAPQWGFLVHKANKGFAAELTSEFFSSMAQKEFDLSSTEITKAFGVVKNSYMSGCFSNIYYLDWNERIVFEEQREQIEFEYLYAYALIDSWNYMFPEKKELTLLEVLDDLSFGKVFGLNDEDVDSVLSTLEERRIISINRQLFPITIVRTMGIEEIIGLIYSVLM